jgi:hypothetical protein
VKHSWRPATGHITSSTIEEATRASQSYSKLTVRNPRSWYWAGRLGLESKTNKLPVKLTSTKPQPSCSFCQKPRVNLAKLIESPTGGRTSATNVPSGLTGLRSFPKNPKFNLPSSDTSEKLSPFFYKTNRQFACYQVSVNVHIQLVRPLRGAIEVPRGGANIVRALFVGNVPSRNY